MKQRIAVVEDSADNSMLVRVMLEDAYELEIYETGTEGLIRISASRPDLVLLDLSLPDIGGREVLLRIRANPALTGLPVIALTAQAIRGDRLNYIALGFDGYLCKPVTHDAELYEVIRRLLPLRVA